MCSAIALLLFFIAYSMFEGDREAYYYHEATKTDDTIKENLHLEFLYQRACVFSMLIAMSTNLFLLLSFAFIFSFFHDGFYYWQRHILNPEIYPKKFFDHSTTSTAFFEFNFTWRLILFIIGLLLFITTLIYMP